MLAKPPGAARLPRTSLYKGVAKEQHIRQQLGRKHHRRCQTQAQCPALLQQRPRTTDRSTTSTSHPTHTTAQEHGGNRTLTKAAPRHAHAPCNHSPKQDVHLESTPYTSGCHRRQAAGDLAQRRHRILVQGIAPAPRGAGIRRTVTLPHLPVIFAGTVWGLPILLPQ